MAAGPAYTRLEADERRAQILAAARRLFAERPMGAVSTTAIAREAGVARGLLHHHFGTRRELELAVVREMLRVPPAPQPADVAGRDLADVLRETFGRWLRAIERDRGVWLASVGGAGIGAGDDVEAIVDEAREQAVDRLVAVAVAFGATESPRLRGELRAYGALVEQAAVELLKRRRLTRDEALDLIVSSFVHITSKTQEHA